MFAVQCFTDAFVSSARTMTFSLQAVCDEIPGFKSWYCEKQETLKSDSLARFFHRYRTVSIHIGDTCVRAGSNMRNADGHSIIKHYFLPLPDLADPPREDVYTACRTHFSNLLTLVLEVYQKFPSDVDDRWYFTRTNFDGLGKSIEDAEAELGFPRGWTDIGDPEMLDERWRMLRKTQTSGCQIQGLFAEYLGCRFPGPDD